MHAHARKLKRHACLGASRSLVYLLPRGPGSGYGVCKCNDPCFSLGLAANFIHLIPSGSHKISLCHGTLPGGLWFTQSVDSSQQVSEGQRPLKQCTVSLGCSAAFRVLNAQSCKCSVYGHGEAPSRSARGRSSSPSSKCPVVPNHHERCTFRSQDDTFTRRHWK